MARSQALVCWYMGLAAAYEATRASVLTWDANIREWGTTDPRPMLLAEKLTIGAITIGASPVLAPLHAMSDACHAEVWARGWSPKRFGLRTERRTMLDFVFA